MFHAVGGRFRDPPGKDEYEERGPGTDLLRCRDAVVCGERPAGAADSDARATRRARADDGKPGSAWRDGAAGRHRRGFIQLCPWPRSEEHTSELQSLMRTSYAVFCLKK